MKDRIPTTDTREWKARKRLGELIASREHLTAMVTFWEGKLAEVQQHLHDTKANLERVKLEEDTTRHHDIPAAVQMDKVARKAELLAAMEKTKAELEKLEASEL